MKSLKKSRRMGYYSFGILFFTFQLSAQQSVNSSGGNGIGIGGSFSFSVGQIDYVYINGVTGSMSQGVQQPFEFFTLATDEIPEISVEFIIYPNPTTDLLFIKNKNLEFSYQMFDDLGRLLLQNNQLSSDAQLDLSFLSTGNYFLKIETIEKKSKTFKIIKK